MENLDADTLANLVKGGITVLSAGLASKPAAVFIEKISGALGWYLEPKQIVRKAHAEAKASLIKAKADQEAQGLTERTAARLLNEDEKHQRNMETVVISALPSIKEDARPEDLNEDWIDNFFAKCRRVSNKEMQQLWAQILAGEANQPGSFSLRTINVLATLTKEDALLFKRLSSYIWTDETNNPTAILTHAVLTGRTLCTISPGEVYHLNDIGLAEYQQLTERKLGGENIIFIYCCRRFNITKLTDQGTTTNINNINVGQLHLTQVGRELSLICSSEPN